MQIIQGVTTIRANKTFKQKLAIGLNCAEVSRAEFSAT